MRETPLVIDVREACRTQKTGKGQWTLGFVTELLRRRIPCTLLTDADIPEAWKKCDCTVGHVRGRGLRWHWNVLRWLMQHPDTVYVSPVSYIVPAFAPASVRCIPVVHDLIAFRREPHDRRATLIERWTLPRAVSKAARLCVISEATKHDLLERFPALDVSRVTAIFAGPMETAIERAETDGSILCVATLCPRKNQLRLIQAYALLPQELQRKHRLILAGGRGWDDEPILRTARETSDVEWLGYVDERQYRSLLSRCTVFALPSLYEGFGMQILDALRAGVPVLTSNRGSLKEVAEGAALIADPEDTASIAEGLRRLLTDERLREELSSAGKERAERYSWKNTVDRFLAAL